jgi:hypothetical protein
MALTNLQRQWRYAAEQLHLRVQVPFVLRFGNGSTVTADVLLEGYGSARGMLIVSDFQRIEGKTEAIMRAGYGYSCMSEPPESEVFSLEGFDEVLKDWGASSTDEKST